MPSPRLSRLVAEYIKESRLDFLTDREGAADQLMALAEKSYVAGHSNLTERSLRRAAELAAEPSAVYAALGSVYYEQQRYEDARDAFNRAIDFDDGSLPALQGLAMSYHMLGMYDKATYYYLAILAEEPNDFASRLNLGLAYHSLGRLEDAVEQLRRACRLGEEQGAPARYVAFLGLGKALYESAQFEAAEEALEQATAINSADSEPFFYLGLTDEALGRPEKAAETYRQAIALNAADAYAHLRLANLLGNRYHDDAVESEAQEVVEHATKALRLFEQTGSREEQASAYWTIGWGLYLSHKWEGSAAASRAALGLDSTLSLVRFNLGLALLRIGQKDEARSVYEEATAGPVDVWMLDRGIEDLEAALRADPSIEGATEILEQFRSKREALVAGVAATVAEARDQSMEAEHGL
jgi:tetratricopeptide (TPR) repeat protein